MYFKSGITLLFENYILVRRSECSSPPSSIGDTFQEPQDMSETADSTELSLLIDRCRYRYI
jgi:hypothetical protein